MTLYLACSVSQTVKSFDFRISFEGFFSSSADIFQIKPMFVEPR